ncbi:MAG TPA: hypothetical protein VM555_01755 [Tahibacter sp.]|nr:hypothetical protein [Tahibacter sp.]
MTLAVAGSVLAAPRWLAHVDHSAAFTIRGAVRCAPACADADADVRLVDVGNLDNSRPQRREAFGYANVRSNVKFRFSVHHEWGRDEVSGEAASLSSFLVVVERDGCESYEREFRFYAEPPHDYSFNLGSVELDCDGGRR